MKIDFSKEADREKLNKHVASLLKKTEEEIRNSPEEKNCPYSLGAHWEIMDKLYEFMPPVPKEEWPSKIKELSPDGRPWPNTVFEYIMAVQCPPFVPWIMLYFGYAIFEDKLVPVAFFVNQKMVDWQGWPLGVVADPIAVAQGINPICYIGRPVDKKDIEAFVVERKHPLQIHIDRVSKEEHRNRLETAYMISSAYQAHYDSTHGFESDNQFLKDWNEGKRPWQQD